MFMIAATSSSKGNGSILILLYFVIFGAFYFLYLRPRSKKQKAARTEARQVEVGERAQTIGGFVGTVVKRTDTLVTMKADSGAELDFVPTAIARRIEPVVETAQAEPAIEEGHDH